MTVKLDGRPLSDFGIELLSPPEHPAAPQTQDITLRVPGRHGVYDFGATLGERSFILNCGLIYEDSAAGVQQRMRELTAFLFNSDGSPRTFQITFDYEPEKYYNVRYSGDIRPERFYSLGTFSLPLVAFDPYAYADMNAYDSPAFYGEADANSYYENTKSFDWKYGRHYSGVFNYSSLSADLIIEIEGTMLNPSITHIESGKKVTLPSIYSSRKVVIDSSKFNVTSNGFNILSQTNGEFITLSPGNNGLLFEADSPNATVSYKWKHKFI